MNKHNQSRRVFLKKNRLGAASLGLCQLVGSLVTASKKRKTTAARVNRTLNVRINKQLVSPCCFVLPTKQNGGG